MKIAPPRNNFRKLQAIITSRCNFTCGMCSIIHEGKDALSEHQVRQLIEDAERLGFDEFEISGGEPYYLPYFRKVLADYAGRTALKIKVCTNAFHLDDELIEELSGRKNIHFQVSFDGTREVHNQIRVQGRYDAFSRSESAFTKLAEAGIQVSLNTVIQRWNVGNILPVYRHFRHVPYLFHGFGIVENGSWNFAENDLRSEQCETLADELETLIDEARHDGRDVGVDRELVLHIRNRARQTAEEEGFPLHPGFGCTVPWAIAIVDQRGNVFPCFHANWEEKSRFNINNGTLAQILESSEYQERSQSRIRINGCVGCTTTCYFHDPVFRRKCLSPTSEDIALRDAQRRFHSGRFGRTAVLMTRIAWKSTAIAHSLGKRLADRGGRPDIAR